MKLKTRITGLVILLLLLGLAGYKLFTPDTVDPLEGTSWKLISYADQYPVEGSVVSAKFEDEYVEGRASWNEFHGSYRIFGNTIEIYDCMVTLEGCINDAICEQEDIIMDFIWYAETFKINAEGQLLIYRADGKALRFERVWKHSLANNLIIKTEKDFSN